MNAQKQSALLLILIFVFAACTEYNDPPLVETNDPNKQFDKDNPKELATSTFRLAAWNIRIFSDGSRTDDELRHIAKVLNKLRLYRYR